MTPRFLSLRSATVARAASLCGVQSLLEFGDIVVEQLEIIGDLFFAADAGHENDNLAAGVPRDGVRCFQIKVWFDDDDLHSITFHLADQFYGVLRAGRNSGSRFDVADNIEAEVFREVGPRAVIGDDFAAGVGFHLRKPLLIGLLQTLLKTGIALREISRVAGAHFTEFVGYAFGDAQTVFRIEPVVRISEWVDVAFGASDLASGNFKNFRITRGIQITGSSNLDFRIGGLRDERRKPADFEFETDDDEQVRSAQLQKKAGLRFDEVRVLIAARDGLDVHFVTANFLREGREVGGGGHDVEFACRLRWPGTDSNDQRHGRKQGENASVQFYSVHQVSPEFLEWMGAMRTHHEEKLKQEFVGVVVTRVRGIQQMAVAILSTDLAELARPVGEDTRKAGVGEARVVGVAAAIEASADSPAAIEPVFGVSVHAESVLRLENVGGRELVACAPEEFGAEEERVVDGAAERLPAQRGIGGIEISQECGWIGGEFAGIVVAVSVGDSKIEVRGFAEIAVGAQMADDAEILAAFRGEDIIRIAAKNLSGALGKPALGSGDESCEREAGIIDTVFAADEIVGDKRAVDVLKSVIVDGVDLAKFGAHFADFEKQSRGKRSEGDVSFFDVHAGFAEREKRVGTSVRINDGLHADFGFVQLKRFAGRDVVVSGSADEIADQADVGIEQFSV